MSEARPPSHQLMLEIAATLGALAHEAEDFGLALCGDVDVAARYLVQLQQIDRISQSLRELARVLEASDPREAVAGIVLGELRIRLEKALAA